MTDNVRNNRAVGVLIHISCWGLILIFPLLFILGHDGRVPDWGEYFKRVVVLSCYPIVFYLNYFLIVPKYFLGGHKTRFILANALLIIVFSLGIQLWQRFVFVDTPPPHFRSGVSHVIIFFIRDAFSMILTIGLACAVSMNREWQKIEAEKREAERRQAEAEKNRTEAELKNLRNQLNPHFLLNTLNNIYALIAFDSEKAQTVVQELSRLMRYVLYDNQNETVPLNREMAFVEDYIALMKIRLFSNVTVETSVEIAPESRKMIAPLLFISLIENAFKHGVSPSEPSFIKISFSETHDSVRCLITNSFHPKSESDKSGSGIGLVSVSRRLELLYPGRYEWKYGVSEDGQTYVSDLRIKVERNGGPAA